MARIGTRRERKRGRGRIGLGGDLDRERLKRAGSNGLARCADEGAAMVMTGRVGACPCLLFGATEVARAMGLAAGRARSEPQGRSASRIEQHKVLMPLPPKVVPSSANNAVF